jgi:hypothetical protein
MSLQSWFSSLNPSRQRSSRKATRIHRTLNSTRRAIFEQLEDRRLLAITGPEVANLLASDGATGDAFGWSVSVDGDTAVVGARFDDDGSGSAYVFTRSVGNWTQQAKLLAGAGPYFLRTAAFGYRGGGI